jgi:hypothetical protein
MDKQFSCMSILWLLESTVFGMDYDSDIDNKREDESMAVFGFAWTMKTN